jgi:hypothetical protein
MHAVTFYHKVAPNGHCATISPLKKGVLLAYYSGPECQDQQHVHMKYLENCDRSGKSYVIVKEAPHRELPNRTGNCILIPNKEDSVVLIFSFFMDSNGPDQPKSPVERWRFCSNWKTNVMESEGEILLGHIHPLGGLQPHIGMLARCSPIFYRKSWLLPLYTEHDCFGIVAASCDGWDWEARGYIGATNKTVNNRFGSGRLIQPTIWEDGNLLKSLSRDITQNHRAWYSESSDGGRTWSTPIKTELWNMNNSLVVIPTKKSTWVVWNHGPNRMQLMLGKWDQKRLDATFSLQLNDPKSDGTCHASYPNYCFDAQNRLHIVHTDCGQIAHHVIDQEMLEYLETIPEGMLRSALVDWEGQGRRDPGWVA